MADTDQPNDALEQINQIRREFERAENAGDASIVDEVCADDVVAIPPRQPSAVGKDAANQALEDIFATVDVEVEYTSQDVEVG